MANFFSRNAMIQRYRKMATMISDERTRKILLDVADEYERLEAEEASFPSVKCKPQWVSIYDASEGSEDHRSVDAHAVISRPRIFS